MVRVGGDGVVTVARGIGDGWSEMTGCYRGNSERQGVILVTGGHGG